MLSDPQRRDRYDLGEDEDGTTDSSHMGGGTAGMNPADLASIFAQFGGAGGGGGGGGGFPFGPGGPRGFRGF